MPDYNHSLTVDFVDRSFYAEKVFQPDETDSIFYYIIYSGFGAVDGLYQNKTRYWKVPDYI